MRGMLSVLIVGYLGGSVYGHAAAGVGDAGSMATREQYAGLARMELERVEGRLKELKIQRERVSAKTARFDALSEKIQEIDAQCEVIREEIRSLRKSDSVLWRDSRKKINEALAEIKEIDSPKLAE